MDDFDVVVVGGGPGGCAAAIACAQAGLTVALIEQSAFPRPHPGETLHPGVEPILKQLGAWQAVQAAGFLRHAGHEVEWFAPRRFEAFGSEAGVKWLGFQAWRADFDRILRDRAISAGVQVMQPCRALRPIWTGDGKAVLGNRVSGVETDRGNLKAQYVIDASGLGGWLQRHCALEMPIQVKCFTPKLVVHYGYAKGECPKRDANPLMVADAEGWTWTARVRPHLYQWTRLNLTGKSSRQQIHKNWLPEEFANLQSVGAIKAADVTWRMAQKVAGLGFFIVGDAGAVLDPASSHGVLKAMMSGMMAAHLAAHVMGKAIESRVDPATKQNETRSAEMRSDEAQCIEVYQQWLESWFLHDTAQLQALYSPWRHFFKPMPSSSATEHFRGALKS